LVARPSNSAPNAAAQRAPALASAASAASASDWQRAAAALREGDLAAAEAALSKLEQSDSVRDRQAAELARAQLLVRRGRVAEAIPTLQRLAREGGTPVIRSQAASMLQTLLD
jgi:predicted Zn-dependent protease